MIRLQLMDAVGVLRGELTLTAAELGINEAELREILPRQTRRLLHDRRGEWALDVAIEHCEDPSPDEASLKERAAETVAKALDMLNVDDVDDVGDAGTGHGSHEWRSGP